MTPETSNHALPANGLAGGTMRCEARPMNDDFATLYSFDRWANNTMLDACRKLSPEQYAAEPIPGWPRRRLKLHTQSPASVANSHESC